MKNPWFVSHRVSATSPTLRLFCFHYAGGSASFCSSWSDYLPDEIELVSMQLPGREQRFSEPYVTEMAALVDTLSDEIETWLDRPFIVFGHSMGAIISYELLCEMQRKEQACPLVFFPSGRQAPQFPELKPLVHALPDQEFCSELLSRSYSSHLASIFANNELKNIFIPQLRADFTLIESYRFSDTCSKKLKCPIVALDGTGGDCSEDHELAGWSEHTLGKFKSRRFPGGHFFIQDVERQVISAMLSEIEPSLLKSDDSMIYR